jgi:transposase InsO family protein
MPWQETDPVDQRERFIDDHRHGLYSMTELCARYGVSRPTGYKWLARYDAGGRSALRPRSHAPHTCPHRVSDAVAELLCAARKSHPTWGPAKLLDWLRPRHRGVEWPAVSTAGDLLARRGLVKPRRRRRPSVHPGSVPATTAEPNDLWTVDFKGQFRTRDGVYCYPLTLADQHTRYLLACRGLPSTKGVEARAVLERAFRAYGLPRAIRSDNGVPFATTGIHGLSQLNVWWLRLGIQHQRILPGQPQQNGAHERMHRTLKAEACRPPQATARAQQRAFDAFRTLYNDGAPAHRARRRAARQPVRHVAAAVPQRAAPARVPGHYLVKRVTNAGTFRFKDRLLFIANALKQHHIGLEESDAGVWSIYLGAVLLARLDERDYVIRG